MCPTNRSTAFYQTNFSSYLFPKLFIKTWSRYSFSQRRRNIMKMALEIVRRCYSLCGIKGELQYLKTRQNAMRKREMPHLFYSSRNVEIIELLFCTSFDHSHRIEILIWKRNLHLSSMWYNRREEKFTWSMPNLPKVAFLNPRKFDYRLKACSKNLVKFPLQPTSSFVQFCYLNHSRRLIGMKSFRRGEPIERLCCSYFFQDRNHARAMTEVRTEKIRSAFTALFMKQGIIVVCYKCVC